MRAKDSKNRDGERGRVGAGVLILLLVLGGMGEAVTVQHSQAQRDKWAADAAKIASAQERANRISKWVDSAQARTHKGICWDQFTDANRLFYDRVAAEGSGGVGKLQGAWFWLREKGQDVKYAYLGATGACDAGTMRSMLRGLNSVNPEMSLDGGKTWEPLDNKMVLEVSQIDGRLTWKERTKILESRGYDCGGDSIHCGYDFDYVTKPEDFAVHAPEKKAGD